MESKNAQHVTSMRMNSMIGRREIKMTIEHDKSSTPSKDHIKNLVSSKFKAKTGNIVVRDCRTKFGTNKTSCYVKIYDSIDVLKKVETRKILNVPKRAPRRARKELKKRTAKLFGGPRRRARFAEKKNKNK